MRTCTLKKLQLVWGGTRKFVEVTDREQAISYIRVGFGLKVFHVKRFIMGWGK